MQVFDNGDQPFLDWMNQNPNGYVVNTYRTSGSAHFKLHKSNCSHISVYGDLELGAFTMRRDIKICADNLSELQIWFFKNYPRYKGMFDICKTCLPTEVSHEEVHTEKEIVVYYEGGSKLLTRIEYERDPKARAACIAKHGYDCKVCHFNFESEYGELGVDYIHVHHITPLFSKKGIPYRVNPELDLVPVCPNCHAMLHRRRDSPYLYSVEELQHRVLNKRVGIEWKNYRFQIASQLGYGKELKGDFL